LRYLEQYAFRLVREALVERERLLRTAPHLVRPLTFVVPHDAKVRPWWFVRAGLVLYDALAWGTSLPRSRGVGRGDAAYRAPLKGRGDGFVYSDARVEDGRLTVLNAVDAAQAGARIETRVAVTGGSRENGGEWRVTLSDQRTVTARAVVNAAGPWVDRVLPLLGVHAASRVRLVKGSHIIVPALYEGDHAYTLEQPDRRIVFAIPWQGRTILGTTDVPVDSPEAARIEPQEIDYLCAAANRFFRRQVAAADVVGSWSGVRPLHDDGSGNASDVTRDYVLELDRAGAPVLSIFGGKITTARALAEEAVEQIAAALGRPFSPRTRDRPLPGGDIADMAAFERDAGARWPFLDAATRTRLVHSYGTRMAEFLGDATCASDLGADLGHGLAEAEVRWLVATEWTRTADDVLLRRTKLGLVQDRALSERVATFLAEHA
jgi:glycerol-3-phosphate dehydrogenase